MKPAVLVFDVNETLIDIESLRPHFERMFGDPQVLREWFNQLVMYSMAITLSGRYTDFFTLGQAALRMTADIRHVDLSEDDLTALADSMGCMPAHADAAAGLQRLLANGFRLVTLTNSPHRDEPTPLERAGLGSYFEHQFSVDGQRAFKPAPSLYTGVAEYLGVAPSDCMMVAAHMWDTLGAQAAGFSGALITRPGNGVLRAPNVPQPTVVASDLLQLNDILEGLS
ncbi:haloacid dehalogenase, type II [Mycolicibacterium peregrinum]|uniref:haloacid dehalogenase type II n=1 Tax=Mycolicibacterium peregrinum TaxID=43304 RepID=UPI0006D7997B|nr:haloacid dehalogenase type II [Mycolicibacterium peregrinum]MCV7204543.1 haloacid dehalogenase type II [Mycolicibacterium peregrinum]ORW56845.1 haloacid dehalogenase [Mycolicibacterium peregrinum]OWL97136.1 haloacid dehalogenase, type II [Mycolicibacterium peregrinum]